MDHRQNRFDIRGSEHTGVIGFLGIPGTGKTFLMAAKFFDAARVAVFNTCGSYVPHGSGIRKTPLPGFTFVYSLTDLIQALRQSGNGPVKVVYTPMDKLTLVRSVELFLQLCMEHGKTQGQMLVAIDEIWNVQKPG